MATLYEIDELILDCIDIETGEIVDFEKLEALQIERDEKILGIALWIKNLEADAKAYKEEKDVFAKKQSVAENKIKSLKGYLSAYLDGQAFKSPKANITFRSSESVDITDITQIPEQFLKYAEPTADKVEIKKMLKSGFTVDGARLVESKNIQVK